VADVGKFGFDTWHLVDKWYGAMWHIDVIVWFIN